MRNVTQYRKSKSPPSSRPLPRQAPDDTEYSSSNVLRDIADVTVGWLMIIVVILFALKLWYGG